jgi:hypothetical protein
MSEPLPFSSRGKVPKSASLPPSVAPEPSLPESLALLPTRDLVLFPYMTATLMVSRSLSAKAVEHAQQSEHKLILLCLQRREKDDEARWGRSCGRRRSQMGGSSWWCKACRGRGLRAFCRRQWKPRARRFI